MEAIELHRDLVVLSTVTNECSLVAHLIPCVWVPSPLICSPPHVVHGSFLPVFHLLSSYLETLVLHSFSLSLPHGLQQCLKYDMTIKSFQSTN